MLAGGKNLWLHQYSVTQIPNWQYQTHLSLSLKKWTKNVSFIKSWPSPKLCNLLCLKFRFACAIVQLWGTWRPLWVLCAFQFIDCCSFWWSFINVVSFPQHRRWAPWLFWEKGEFLRRMICRSALHFIFLLILVNRFDCISDKFLLHIENLSLFLVVRVKNVQ